MTAPELLGRLKGVRPTSTGWVACCPAHDDRHASLSVSAGDDGRVLLHCHAGCDTAAIVAALGLGLADLFPAKPATPRANRVGRAFPSANEAVAALERQHGPRSALWTYHDATGEPVGLVVRWDRRSGKEIRPIARRADGWHIAAMAEPRSLYRLPEVRNAPRVIVTEGEKCADAARSLGFVATTSAGGSQAAAKTDWRPLAGKEVWILPDHDAPGRKYAETVAGILAKLTPAPIVRIVELPGLPEGGDIVDWIQAHGDAAEPDGMREEIETLAARPVATSTPHPAYEPDLDFRPFPLEVFPEAVRAVVDTYARSIGCDTAYVAVPALVVASAAVGMSRQLMLKRGWYAPPILWAAVVAESGSAKTPALRAMLQPLQARQRQLLERWQADLADYETQLARYEADYAQWRRRHSVDDPPTRPARPQPRRLLVRDTTVEALAPILAANPRGVLAVRDELAGWIGSFDRYAKAGKAGADAANWLSMYSAEALQVDRKTGDRPVIWVPRAATWVLGGIQPGTLRRCLTIGLRESGLAARLLLTMPPRRPRHWTDDDVPDEIARRWAYVINRLGLLEMRTDDPDEGPLPQTARLSDDARAVWVAHFEVHNREAVALDGDLAAAWAKLEETAARLALVIHYLRWATEGGDDLTVSHADMRAGITLVEWFKHEARRVYETLDESDSERDRRRLLEWIRRQGGTVTVRQTQMGCRWLREPGAASAALQELAQAGYGVWSIAQSSGQGGRPTHTFVLCQHVNETPSGVIPCTHKKVI